MVMVMLMNVDREISASERGSSPKKYPARKGNSRDLD